VKAGIIGGTGFYDPGLLENEKDVKMSTPFGDIKLKSGYYHDVEILFLPRHGNSTLSRRTW